MKPFFGSPLRPKKYGCHGQLVQTQGVSLTSAWSDTGLVVSGVPAAISRSTLSPRIEFRRYLGGTAAARLAVLGDDLHLVGAPAALDAFLQDSAHLIHDEAVGLAEAGEWAGARAHMADADDLRLGACRIRADQRGRSDGGDAAFHQCATVHGTLRRAAHLYPRKCRRIAPASDSAISCRAALPAGRDPTRAPTAHLSLSQASPRR